MGQSEGMTTLANNIRFLMQKAGWTQNDLAEACGWTQSEVSKLINAKSNPTLSTMELVAKAFGLQVHELLTPQKHSEKEQAA